MSGVKTVENLTIAFSGTNLTATGTLTKGQVAANCIPFVTFRSTRDGNESFDDRLANCTIGGSTVTLTRNTGTSFTLEYKVSVVEFEPSLVKVQTGEVTMTGTSQTDAPGTNFADIADVFMVFTHITTDTTDDLDALTVRGQVTNTSTITFTRGDSANQHTMRWYAAEALSSEFSVIRSSFTISGASVSATDTISSVTSAKSFTIFSTSETGETTDDWRDGVGRGDLQSDTLVRFRRSNGGTPTGATITIEYQVVTFADNETVQRGEFSMGSGSTSDTDTITALTNAESTAWSPMIFGRGEGASTDGDDMGQMHAAMDFTSDTVIRGQLVTDVTAGLWSWEAIEWELPVIGVNSVDTDNDIDDAQTGVVVAGFGFNAAQGTGLVEIGDSSDYATANKVTQTVTAWGDTSITITADLGSQAPGTKYLFVTDDDSNRSIGFAITMRRAKAFAISLSGNIAASGENTTVQLTAPTSGAFGGGRIQDDENPTDTVDIGDDQFREDEWCIEALPAAVGGETYQFRVLFEGVVADTITVTPQITIAAAGTTITVPVGSLSLAGIAPVAFVEITVSPTVQALVLTGQAPTLFLEDIRAPPAGSLSLTGIAPSAEEIHNSLVPVGSLVLAGIAPSAIEQDDVVTPGAGSLSLSGGIPLRQSLVWINSDPSKDGNEVLCVINGDQSATSISFDDAVGAPTGTVYIGVEKADGTICWSAAQTASTGDTTITVPVGSLSLTGVAPTAFVESTASPAAGSLSLTGQAPSAEEAHDSLVPVGSLSLSGIAPDPLTNHIASPGVGSLTLTGQTPSAEETHDSLVPAGSLSLTGNAPSIDQDHDISVPVGALALTGTFPAIEIGITAADSSLFFDSDAPTVQEAHDSLVPVGALAFGSDAPTASIITSAGGKSMVLYRYDWMWDKYV